MFSGAGESLPLGDAERWTVEELLIVRITLDAWASGEQRTGGEISHRISSIGDALWDPTDLDGSAVALRRQVKIRSLGTAPNAPGTIRTCDLPLRRRTLYPLSYGRVRSG
jgi:hypothetical protein